MCAIKIRDTHRNTRRRRHMSQDTQRSFAFAVMEKERACHQVAFARERLADQICDDRLDIHARVARAGCCDRERVRAVVDERPLDAKPSTLRALCKRDRRIARACRDIDDVKRAARSVRGACVSLDHRPQQSMTPRPRVQSREPRECVVVLRRGNRGVVHEFIGAVAFAHKSLRCRAGRELGEDSFARTSPLHLTRNFHHPAERP